MKKQFAIPHDFRYPLPLVCTVKEVDRGATVSDEELSERLAKIAHFLAYTPSWNPPADVAQSESSPKSNALVIDNLMHKVLNAVMADSYRTGEEIRKAINVKSVSAMRRATGALCDMDFLMPYEVRISRAVHKPFDALDKAYAYMKIKPPKKRGKGKFVHRYVINRFVVPYFENKGLKVQLEKNGADVVVTNSASGEKIAVEVELHDTPHVIDNLCRNRDSGMKRVIVACETRDMIAKLKKRVLAERTLHDYLDSVKYVLFSYFAPKKNS